MHVRGANCVPPKAGALRMLASAIKSRRSRTPPPQPHLLRIHPPEAQRRTDCTSESNSVTVLRARLISKRRPRMSTRCVLALVSAAAAQGTVVPLRQLVLLHNTYYPRQYPPPHERARQSKVGTQQRIGDNFCGIAQDIYQAGGISPLWFPARSDVLGGRGHRQCTWCRRH